MPDDTRDDNTDIQRTDWAQVDRALKKDERADSQLTTTSRAKVPVARAPEDLSGVLAKYKAGKIQNRAALEAYQDVVSSQLDVFRHGLSEASRVKKAEASLMAEHFLENLNAKYQELITGIGLKNVDAKMDNLKRLSDQTAIHLKDILEKDWPPSMRDKMIENVEKLWSDFSKKLMKDIEEPLKGA